jgi:hypothetical protein
MRRFLSGFELGADQGAIKAFACGANAGRVDVNQDSKTTTTRYVTA